MSENDVIPWTELSTPEKLKFAQMLNKRFDANVSVDEAREYYGNPEKAKADFGEGAVDGGPECSECFTTLYRDDIPHLKRTGECPNCGAELVERE